MVAKQSRMAELASCITKHAEVVDAYLNANNLPHPAFHVDGLTELRLPPEIETSRAFVEEATLELNDLMRGPRELLMDNLSNYLAVKAFISKFDIANLIPIDGSVSYADLATKTGVSQSAIETCLRLAIAHRIFCEPEYGQVAHTVASRLARDPQMAVFLQANSEDFFHMSVNLTPALTKYPKAEEPNQAGAALANGTDSELSFYQVLGRDPPRAARFHAALQMYMKAPGLSWQHVVDGYDWGSLPEGSLAVDVGGGPGGAALAVAQKYPHIKWIVQDYPAVENPSKVPSGLSVSFMAHDFFEIQPLEGVSIFFIRWVLHNWPDSYCIRILRALIPALTTGTKILVMEMVMPIPGTKPNAVERKMRSMGVSMLKLVNGMERDAEQWREFFHRVDERFVLKNITQPGGSQMAMIEVVWEG